MAGVYQNSDATLADVMGGGSVAAQQYFNQDATNAQALAEEQIKQATVPAEIQKPYLGNLFTAAQTAAEQGLAQQQQAKGAQDIATLGGNIGATNAGNQAKITSAHLDQMDHLGQIVGGLASYMDNIPPAARPAMLQQVMDQNNVTDPTLRQSMMAMDPTNMPDALRQISQGLFQTSQQARQTSLGENIRGGYQLGVAQIGASGREAIAEANAQARENVARINAQVKQQQQTFEQAAVAAQKRGDMATYQQMSQLAMQMKQAQAQLNSQLLFGQGLPNPAIGAPADTGTPATPQAPSTQGQPPVEDAVTAEMRKRGLLK